MPTTLGPNFGAWTLNSQILVIDCRSGNVEMRSANGETVLVGKLDPWDRTAFPFPLTVATLQPASESSEPAPVN